jgi:type I restriction enzyme M protein
MMSKFEDYAPGNRDKPGSRTAIVFNGSPLFTGGAGSGESEIRRWIIERDQLEAIVALPEQMFYNTGIGTFIWVVTNRKAPHRKGKIQLIDARERYTPMKRSLGDKRRYLDQAALDAVTREHGACEEQPDQPRVRQHRLRLSPHQRAAPAAPALRDHRRGT